MSDINEIISKEALAGLEKAEQLTVQLANSLLKITEDGQKVSSTLSGISKSTGTAAEKAKALTDAQKEQKRINDDNQRTITKLNAVLSGTTRELNENKQALKNANRESNLAVVANNALKGSYNQIQSQLSLNIAKLKAMSAEQRTSTKEGRQLETAIKKQTIELKKLDARLGVHNRNVGNYAGSIKSAASSLLGAFGLVGGVMLFAKVLKDAFNTMKQFEQSMARVKGITGATDEEFRKLEKDALRLGAATEFTSSQVADLQVEFAKLGFTTQEIINTTEATLDLATATGADLARAAEIAGSTIRSFGIDTSESKRVVDVMAKSFTSSALDIEKWAESVKYVAPVANAAGISIEETASMLSVLADNGISGSMAGTALRKMFLELTDDGKPLSEKLKELADRGLSLADAQGEVGERAQTALLVLTDQIDKLPILTDKYNNATGASKEMADVMRNTVEGSLKSLSSAWEGLILSFKSSEGGFKAIIDWFTNVTRNVTSAIKGIKDLKSEIREASLNEAIKEDRVEIERIAESLVNNGVPATEAFERAKKLLRLQFIRERAEVYDNAEEYDRWTLRINEVENAQIAVAQEIDNTNGVIEDQTATIIRANNIREMNALSFEGEITNIHKAEIEKREQADIDFIAREDERNAERLEKIKENAMFATQAVMELGQIGHEFTTSLLQAEMGQIQERYDNEILLAGDNAAKKEKAEKKYQDERKKLLNKQAKIDKAFAIFQSTINFAQALIAALTVPPPASFVFEAITAALAGIQLAAVIATPLPQYAKGTRSARRGLAVVGEKGRELVIGKDGQMALTPGTASLVNMGGGGQRIIPNKETELLLRAAKGADDHSSRELLNEIKRGNDRLVDTIKNKSEIHIHDGGRKITERKGNYYRHYRDRAI